MRQPRNESIFSVAAFALVRSVQVCVEHSAAVIPATADRPASTGTLNTVQPPSSPGVNVRTFSSVQSLPTLVVALAHFRRCAGASTRCRRLRPRPRPDARFYRRCPRRRPSTCAVPEPAPAAPSHHRGAEHGSLGIRPPEPPSNDVPICRRSLDAQGRRRTRPHRPRRFASASGPEFHFRDWCRRHIERSPPWMTYRGPSTAQPKHRLTVCVLPARKWCGERPVPPEFVRDER